MWYDFSEEHCNVTLLITFQCFSILLCGWLGGFGKNEAGQLLTIEEVGQVLQSMSLTMLATCTIVNPPSVPVNVKDRDTFHLTIEEYLLSLISLLDELVSCFFFERVHTLDWLTLSSPASPATR